MTGRSSQVARGLNTIAANIVANQDALKVYGIEVSKAGGELRSTFDVLQDLSKIWDKLSDTQKVTLGTMLAGKNQYKVLASVLTNFATASNATATAMNSMGSAAEENAKYMESIEARVTAVSSAFQQMALKVVDSDIVKGILDIVKAFAELGSTNVGSAITQIVLLSGVSWGGLQLLGQSILPGIIGGFKAFGSVLKGVTLEATAASLGFKGALSAGLAASLPVILGVTAAIVALVDIIKGIKTAYDEANPSVEEALTKLEESKTEYKSVEEKYQEAKTRLDELNATPFDARTAEIQKEMVALQSLISYYEQLTGIRKSQAAYSGALYAKAVEKEGISVGGYTLKGTFADAQLALGTEAGSAIKSIEGYYNSLEDAIYSAAGAVLTFDEDIAEIDMSNIAELQDYLSEYGIEIKENVITISQLSDNIDYAGYSMRRYKDDILANDVLLQNFVKDYQNLTSLGQEYYDALKLQDWSSLNKEQQEFIMRWDTMVTEYEHLIDLSGGVSESVLSQTESFFAAGEALSGFAQSLLSAKSAYEQFKAILEQTGDYDDSFKGLVSVFGELNGEWEKGQVGSRAFLTALELLTGKTFDSESATQYLTDNLTTLELLFGDSESGGLGLISAMQKLQEEGKLTGASVEQVGDNLEISVTSFSDLASSLGISESALYSLTQALKVLGIDFSYTSDDILDKVKDLGDGIVENLGDKTTVNFEEFVKQAKLAGMSTDEILQIGEVLSDTAGIDLNNVNEGMALLTGGAEDGTGAANDLESSLEGVGDTAGAVQGTADAVSDLSSNLSSAAGSASSLYRNLSNISGLKFPSLPLRFNAEGTNYAEEGDSLVNEEGPELIQSGDKAYIAGGGNPTITHLNRGDRVYTAEETKDILGGKNVDSIQAHVFGATGIGGGKAVIPLTDTGGSSSFFQKTIDKLKEKLGSGSTKQQQSSNSNSKTTSASSESKTVKDIFDEWLKAKKHALAMDEISEKEYYEELEKMNEKYFKNSKEYQDEYWKYQEEIYKWRKSQLEDENRLLEKQIELEEALGELQKAKEQKILVYKDGKFQYIQDIDAISKARDEVAKISAEMGIEGGYATYFTTNKSGYANGTSNASAGLHLVGENGPELRVLNSGDGIIPSDVTRNLLSLAGYNNSKFSNGLDRIKQILYSFNIDNLSLPNVSNPTEFFDGLKNYAYQYSYAQ